MVRTLAFLHMVKLDQEKLSQWRDQIQIIFLMNKHTNQLKTLEYYPVLQFLSKMKFIVTNDSFQGRSILKYQP